MNASSGKKAALCVSQLGAVYLGAELGAVDHGAELGAKICGAKAGAKIYGAELGNTSAPREQLLWPAPQGSAPYTAAPRRVSSAPESTAPTPGFISANRFKNSLYVKFFCEKS